MADKKMIHTKFGDVPRELFDQIESIRDHSSMLAANAKLQKLREDLQVQNEKIQKHPSDSENVDTEAKQILAGDSLEETRVANRQELIRRRESLEKAIHLQGGEIQKLESRLIREGLVDLEPLAKKYAQERIKILVDVEKALKKQDELFVTLRVRGYRQDYLPLKFRSSPLETQLLRGGVLPSLGLHLQKLRELWGFKAVGPHIKG